MLSKIQRRFIRYRKDKKIKEGGRGRIGYPIEMKELIAAAFDEGIPSAELAAAAKISIPSVNNFIKATRPNFQRKRGPQPGGEASRPKTPKKGVDACHEKTEKKISIEAGKCPVAAMEFLMTDREVATFFRKKDCIEIVLKLRDGGVRLLINKTDLRSMIE